MSWALHTAELVSKGSRPSGSTRAVGNQPARAREAERTSIIGIDIANFGGPL